jgi:putative oxidoreductase
MTVIRRIARPMLAAVFVTGGLDALLHPSGRAKVAELLVRANGATMVVAGAMLGVGRFPRLAALVLAGALVPTTYTAHAFWTVQDPAAKAQQKAHFMKNVGLLGGVLLASVDTAGKPGLAYRTRYAQAHARRQAALTRREARRAAHRAQHFAKHALD